VRKKIKKLLEIASNNFSKIPGNQKNINRKKASDKYRKSLLELPMHSPLAQNRGQRPSNGR
jgi:hypothetical protein